MWLIIAMAIGATLAIAGIAMKRVEAEDRRNGLNLDAKEYSVFAPLRHIRQSSEDRLKVETAPSFQAYLRKSGGSADIARVSFVALPLCAAAFILSFVVGDGNAVLAAVTAGLLFLAGLSSNLLVPLFMLAITLFCISSWVTFLLIAADTLMLLALFTKKREYKKAIFMLSETGEGKCHVEK